MELQNIEDVIVRTLATLVIKQIEDQQKQVILSFVGGRDVFVALPIGFGKSIIYGCLPRAFD
jgi:superfamily II DNA helicase RecQ